MKAHAPAFLLPVAPGAVLIRGLVDAVAFLLSAVVVTASASGASEAYDRGIAAFRDGEYAVAAAEFERTLALGRREGRVHYNLGSAYYHLGRFDKAEESFQRAAQFPETRAMSWYNLGLIAIHQRDWMTAADRLLKIDTASAPELTRDLSPIALEHVRHEMRLARFNLRVNSGYNSNVVGLSDIAPSPYAGQGSEFVDVSAAFNTGRGEFLGAFVHGLVSAYGNHYPGKEAVNAVAGTGSLAAERPDAHGMWRLSLGAGKLWYGGDEHQASTQAFGMRSVRWRDLSGQAGYEFAHVDGLADPGLSGSRQTVTLGAGLRMHRSRISSSYVREANNRSAPGHSPVRNDYQIGWAYRRNGGQTWVLNYRRRSSRYPISGAFSRKDVLDEGGIEYLHPLSKRWSAGASVRIGSNSSNEPAFSYSQSVVFVGLSCDI